MNSKTTAPSAQSGARSADAISRATLHLWDIVAYWPAVALATVGAATVALAKGRGPRMSPTDRVVLTSGLGAVTLFGFARWQLSRHFTEKPSYDLERRVGDIEIRRYEKRVQAETTVQEADWDKALNEGFRRLAGYIFGGNDARRNIAMTAPVTSMREPSSEKIAMTVPVTFSRGGGGHTVAFTMPRDRKLASRPVPKDARVALREVPAHRLAALRWSGTYRASTTLKKQRALLTLVKELGLTPIGEPQFAGYDAPSTLPFLRRNEVWVEID